MNNLVPVKLEGIYLTDAAKFRALRKVTVDGSDLFRSVRAFGHGRDKAYDLIVRKGNYLEGVRGYVTRSSGFGFDGRVVYTAYKAMEIISGAVIGDINKSIEQVRQELASQDYERGLR